MKILLAACALALTAIPARAADKAMAQFVEVVKLEKKVKEALWPNGSPNSFWVSVKDDGTPRDGFAEYLCALRGDTTLPEDQYFTIRVFAIGSTRQIGEAECGG